MMRLPMLVAVVAISSAAHAKPLPEGWKVFLERGKPVASKSGMIVPLRDDSISDFDRLVDAHLSDDGAQIVIRADRCKGMLGEVDESSVAFAKVEARIENALGMAKHVKKVYADAIPHFAAAVAKDPDNPMYATNLLSAQSLAKKLEDADQTIAALTAKAAPWLAWRLAVDPELANVRARASTPCAKKQLAAVATRRKLADSLLASLGFEKVDAEMKPLDDLQGATVEANDDTVTATRGKTKKTLTIFEQRVHSAAVFAQGVVLDLDHRHLVSCDDQGGVGTIGALALP
jgi:hypothetical protein